ncbi:hypothetical protein ACA910_013847 [Epithemia clementina (nom. ined.)]
MLNQIPQWNSSFRRVLLQPLWLLRGDNRVSVQMMLGATALSPQLCRFQSFLCSTTTRSSSSQDFPLHPSAGSQKLNRRATVNPSSSVTGQPVASHIQDDLISPPAATATASVDGHALLSSDQLQQQPFKSEGSRKREYESDLVVVLDMDECLIHSKFLYNPTTEELLAHESQCRRPKEISSCPGSSLPSPSPSKVDHFSVYIAEKGVLVHVNVRPGLENFLNEITSRYETHIFTAAIPEYANHVLDHFDPDRTKFAGRWYCDHCTYDGELQADIKNLSVLPLQNLARAVLIDDRPLSFLANPSNGILVPKFFDNPEDDTFEAVKQLLAELESYEDVRPVLEDRFGIKEALEKIIALSSLYSWDDVDRKRKAYKEIVAKSLLSSLSPKVKSKSNEA